MVRFTGLSIGPDLNWLPIKQSAYLTSLPLPVLSFPVPLNIPPTSISVFSPPPSHRAPLHRHIHLSLSVIPLLPSPLPPRPLPHPHSLLQHLPPLFKPLSLSITIQRCIRFLSPSISHLSPDLIFALFLSYTFSQSIHHSLLK